MKSTRKVIGFSPLPLAGIRWRGALTGLLLSGGVTLSQAALPQPLVNLRYSEGTGLTTANEGSLGGAAGFVQADELPAFTASVPSGPFAPASNAAAVDFGTIAAGQGGRALDLVVAGEDPTLGSMTAFTVCGWVNARQLTEGGGGNRIAFALNGPAGPGFDLVQLGNGALRLGVNNWPDAGGNPGPASGSGKITADPAAGMNNWVFFAVTYDSALVEDR